MLLAVEGVRYVGAGWTVELRLALAIVAGAAVYAGVIVLLARGQLLRVRDVVVKRRRPA